MKSPKQSCKGCGKCLESEAATGEICVQTRDCECHAPASSSEPWATQRQNLLKSLQKYPAITLDVIDAAYLAGLEASREETSRLLATSQRELIAKLEEVFPFFYCEHTSDCIRSQFEAGTPTDDGGYKVKYAGKWYEAKPVDKTPKCDCGLDKALSAVPPTPLDVDISSD